MWFFSSSSASPAKEEKGKDFSLPESVRPEAERLRRYAFSYNRTEVDMFKPLSLVRRLEKEDIPSHYLIDEAKVALVIAVDPLKTTTSLMNTKSLVGFGTAMNLTLLYVGPCEEDKTKKEFKMMYTDSRFYRPYDVMNEKQQQQQEEEEDEEEMTMLRKFIQDQNHQPLFTRIPSVGDIVFSREDKLVHSYLSIQAKNKTPLVVLDVLPPFYEESSCMMKFRIRVGYLSKSEDGEYMERTDVHLFNLSPVPAPPSPTTTKEVE